MRLTYRGRRAVGIENDRIRLVVLEEGGHVAEVLDKRTGVNPLWTPPWPSIEPSAFEPARDHVVYGETAEARLLGGIMGHNICLDVFGPPSPEEARAGLPVHGEGPVVPYAIEATADALTARAELPIAQIAFERQIVLAGSAVRVQETIANLARADRPIGWTQHVTLGPPFLERGATVFRASAARSKVFDAPFGDHSYLEPGAEFDWPNAPGRSDGPVDLQMFTGAPRSSAYTTHLMDRRLAAAWFVAFSAPLRLAFGYVWQRAAFPWLGIWEENFSRQGPPWNGRTLARGMEFGVSPFPETRRQMIDRGELFGEPGYRWVPAKSSVSATYWIVVREAEAIPESLDWPEE